MLFNVVEDHIRLSICSDLFELPRRKPEVSGDQVSHRTMGAYGLECPLKAVSEPREAALCGR